MPSQFFGLNIGYTGLQAANAALNVTGNNISNVETKGYTRQEAVQSAANALRTNTTYGMAGAGVDTISIDQIRNNYYDIKYWQNNASLGIYEIKQQYYRQIEDYFTDKDDVMGFNAIYSDLFELLDEVYKSSGEDAKVSSFLSECTTLSEYFSNTHTSLKRLQKDANDEILNKANEINALASEIATLNKQINAIEITGPKANELRDKRALLVDQLSKVVDVQIQEVPIPISENSDVPSGTYRYIVDIANGQNLVNGYDYSQITCVGRDADHKVNQSDADGLYDLYLNDLSLNLYGGSLGGELKGLLEVRDGNNGELFSAKESEIDGNKVKVTIDKSNPNFNFLIDMNKSTLNAAGTIVIGNKEFKYNSWEFEVTKDADDNPVYTYTFNMEDDEITGNEGTDVRIGVNLNYQGIPYYQAQLNEWVRSFAQAMNIIELGAQTNDGNPAEVMFTYDSLDSKNNKCDDYYKDPNKTDSTKDNYQKMTAFNFHVNTNMLDDVRKFGTTADITKGQDAQDITAEMMKVKTDKSKMAYRGCSSNEFLQCLTSDVALGAASANSFCKNFTTISQAITAQRTSVSGVDNDEEALNLVKFQEAYNLAAKMIQTMTEIYDRLILSTGV